MSNVKEVQPVPPGQKAPGHGAFQIQFTDEARKQLDRLDSHLSTTVQEKLHMVAAGDPYAHGADDPAIGHRDRRIVVIETLVVTLWVIAPLRILTIVNIREGRTGFIENEPQEPLPDLAILPGQPGPFGADDDDEEDEDEVYLWGRVGAVSR
jgi:hypothetical protein